MSTLKEAEDEIGTCLVNARTNFLRVAELIVQVRDEQLYLQAFPTFEKWCEEGMGWTKRRANQLIAGAETVNELPPSLAAEVKTESQARALSRLDREDQKKAIREAKKEGVSITKKAKSFSEKPATIDQNRGTVVPAQLVEPEQILDEPGYPIPAKIQAFWKRREEIQVLMTAVSRVKTAVAKGREEDDALFRQINQGAIDQLERTYSFLSDAKPYAVCLTCQGRAFDACRVCKGTGLISKFGYETRGDKASREMREKVIAQRK